MEVSVSTRIPNDIFPFQMGIVLWNTSKTLVRVISLYQDTYAVTCSLAFWETTVVAAK